MENLSNWHPVALVGAVVVASLLLWWGAVLFFLPFKLWRACDRINRIASEVERRSLPR